MTEVFTGWLDKTVNSESLVNYDDIFNAATCSDCSTCPIIQRYLISMEATVNDWFTFNGGGKSILPSTLARDQAVLWRGLKSAPDVFTFKIHVKLNGMDSNNANFHDFPHD